MFNLVDQKPVTIMVYVSNFFLQYLQVSTIISIGPIRRHNIKGDNHILQNIKDIIYLIIYGIDTYICTTFSNLPPPTPVTSFFFSSFGLISSAIICLYVFFFGILLCRWFTYIPQTYMIGILNDNDCFNRWSFHGDDANV